MATLADCAFRRAGSLLVIADGRRAGVLGSGTTPPEEGNVDTTLGGVPIVPGYWSEWAPLLGRGMKY